MRKAFIYALCEPGSRKVRYIGQTVNPQVRFKHHLSGSSKKKTHLGYWLKSVLDAGQVPNLVVLCETTEDQCNAEEIRYISAARAIGIRLTNATDGGEGMPNPSPETRARMSAAHAGKKLSPEHRAKMSEAQRGRTVSAETRAKIAASNRGKKHSAETRAKVSAVQMGKKLSLEHRSKIGAAHRGRKLSLEHRANISAAKRGNKVWLGRKHSAESRAKMSAIARGKKHSPETRAKIGAATTARHLREREIKAKK